MRCDVSPRVVILGAGRGSRARTLTRIPDGRPAPKQCSMLDGRSTTVGTSPDRRIP
ncbi:MAG: hypothetical protein AB1Z65_13550 [Candidatus Sulfomarinibacteraceae bacterium]